MRESSVSVRRPARQLLRVLVLDTDRLRCIALIARDSPFAVSRIRAALPLEEVEMKGGV